MSGVVPAVSFSIARKYSIFVPRASSSSLRKMTHTHCASSSAFSQPRLLLRYSSDPPATPPIEFLSTPSYEPDVPPEIPGPPAAPEVQPIPPEFPADPPPNSPGPNPGPELPRPPIPSPPGPEVPSPGKEIPWPVPGEPIPPQPPEILPPKPPKHWTADPPDVQPQEPTEIKPPEVPVRRSGGRGASRIRASDGGASYLDTWKKAVDRDRKALEFHSISENSGADDGVESVVTLERKGDEFMKILEVPKEERDRVQRMQVIDRAAAAIAAARAILQEIKAESDATGQSGVGYLRSGSGGDMGVHHGDDGVQSGILFVPQSQTSGNSTPCPDFWSWTPPRDSGENSGEPSYLKTASTSSPYLTPAASLMEKEQSVDFLSIPYESQFSDSSRNPPAPPLQSFMEISKKDVSSSSPEIPSLKDEDGLDVQFLSHAAEAAQALAEVDSTLRCGVNPDGSRWWRETGIEQRPDGVVCRWTLIRGVSADHAVEWEDKYWEAADKFQYKELGSEKSGRDAKGNVWSEYWKELMWQDNGIVHMEKTADKWGKNGKGDEWHEKWQEQYDASGKAEKWAHKWCSIDPNTQLEAGHAHVWHERWGERYDGCGGSMKYTDKWAERCEGDGWSKWGDKWDENFDPNGHGVKQGETWWEGKHGRRWNRTWGEGHNGSGWVHKYGKSSSGDHWDTHVEEDTWYERFSHYGFHHCYENSVQLRAVQPPLE